MDLNDLKPTKDTLEVILLHPKTLDALTNADGSEMTITVYGPHTAPFKAAIHEATNKRIQKAAKNKKLSVTAEEVEDAGLEFLAKVTKEWDITLGGKKPVADLASVTQVYRDFPWIKDQVNEAIEDINSFLK